MNRAATLICSWLLVTSPGCVVVARQSVSGPVNGGSIRRSWPGHHYEWVGLGARPPGVATVQPAAGLTISATSLATSDLVLLWWGPLFVPIVPLFPLSLLLLLESSPHVKHEISLGITSVKSFTLDPSAVTIDEGGRGHVPTRVEFRSHDRTVELERPGDRPATVRPDKNGLVVLTPEPMRFPPGEWTLTVRYKASWVPDARFRLKIDGLTIDGAKVPPSAIDFAPAAAWFASAFP